MAEPSITSIIYQGSYKGFLFKFKTASTTGGRKHAVHEYPNRDTQSVEDLGLKPRVYNLNIIVNAPQPSGYLSYKKELLEILESEGPGILVHPLYGTLNDMACVSWSLDEEDASLGYATLKATFEVDDSTGIPTEADLSLVAVNSAMAKVNTAMTASFTDGFEIPDLFGAATDAISKVNDAITVFEDATSFVPDISSEAQAFSNSLGELAANVSSLIKAPSELAAEFNNVFTNLENLYTTFDSTLQAFENLFTFGSDDPTTPKQAQVAKNNKLLTAIVTTNALAGAYAASAGVEYTTADEIDEVSSRLDVKLVEIYEDDTIPYDVKKALAEARVVVGQYYNEQRVRAATLVPIYVNNRAARLISYQYYATSERGEEIADLNNTADVSFINGDIQILSD